MALFISMRKPRLTWTSPLSSTHGHAEHDHALGLGDALEDLRLAVLGVLVEHELEGLGDLLGGLMELGLAGVLGLELGHEFVDECAHVVPST